MSSQFLKSLFVKFNSGTELEYTGGVHDILGRRTPVHIGRRPSANRFAYLLNQRNDRKTRASRSFGQRLEIDLVWVGRVGNLVRGCLRDDTDTRFSTRQGSFHFD